jgi:hypothetical protein
MSRGYSAGKASFGEWFGLIFGGGSIAAMLVFQVVFVARLAGFG